MSFGQGVESREMEREREERRKAEERRTATEEREGKQTMNRRKPSMMYAYSTEQAQN